ncbi:MAG TPA: hypothetical protein VJ729_12550 [Nitrososphaeraceae archaeon]|nr:hypothetical protein [Nitrososphaeraceae archaeon]
MSKETSQLPDEYEELDFMVQQENWNDYELVDNSRLKARSILRKIYADPHTPNVMMFDFNPPIVAIYSPQSNRGERNNMPKPEEYNTLPSFEVIIQHNDEKWNRYRILKSGQEIRTKLIATEIRRIKDRYNNDGAPFYLYYSATPSVYMNPIKDALRP